MDPTLICTQTCTSHHLLSAGEPNPTPRTAPSAKRPQRRPVGPSRWCRRPRCTTSGGARWWGRRRRRGWQRRGRRGARRGGRRREVRHLRGGEVRHLRGSEVRHLRGRGCGGGGRHRRSSRVRHLWGRGEVRHRRDDGTRHRRGVGGGDVGGVRLHCRVSIAGVCRPGKVKRRRTRVHPGLWLSVDNWLRRGTAKDPNNNNNNRSRVNKPLHEAEHEAKAEPPYALFPAFWSNGILLSGN